MIEFIKIDKIKAQQIPNDGFFWVLKNRFWAVKDGNILFYKSFTSPQCNLQKSIMEQSSLVKNGAEIEFIETVFVRHSCSDFL